MPHSPGSSRNGNKRVRHIRGDIAERLTQFSFFRGRVALSAILRALGVGRGDEVILQAFTCVAVPEGIMSVGAKPVYVDVAPDSPNMDAQDLQRKITPRTRAVIVQHSYGLPADMSQLLPVTRQHGLPVIEDCAHTVMSRIAGELVGSFGDAAFYSYEAAKPVFVGIGGSAIANSESLGAHIAREYALFEEPSMMAQLENEAMLHAYHVAYRPSTYWAVRSVFRALSKAGVIRGNYNKVDIAVGPASDFSRRMGSMQVRRLRQELKQLGRQTDHRLRVAEQYRSRISGETVRHFAVAPGVEPVFGRYPMIAKDKRDLVERARDARVELAVFYDTPVQPLTGDALRTVGYEPGSCPEAEHRAQHVVSLPTGYQVTPRVIDRTVKFFNERIA